MYVCISFTSDAAIIAAINLANDASNLILQNSAVNLRLRIVFITQAFDPNLVEPSDSQAGFLNPSGITYKFSLLFTSIDQ